MKRVFDGRGCRAGHDLMSGRTRGRFFNKGWLEFTGRTVDQELGEGMAERGSQPQTWRTVSRFAALPL